MYWVDGDACLPRVGSMSNVINMDEYRARTQVPQQRLKEDEVAPKPSTPEEAMLLAAYAVAEKEATALKVQFDKVLEGVKFGEMNIISTGTKVDK